ncbi:hypothetical protein LINPERHAP1_LOCUS9353, partial [Linum perenne]
LTTVRSLCDTSVNCNNYLGSIFFRQKIWAIRTYSNFLGYLWVALQTKRCMSFIIIRNSVL